QGMLPAPQTPPGPASAAAPQGLLPPQAPQAAPAIPRAPAAPGAAMGGINPAYIAWAQKQARIYSALGMTPPADVVAAAGLPLVGPKAWREAAAQFPYKIGETVAPQIERGNQSRQTQAEKFAFEPHFENGVLVQPATQPGFVAPPSLTGSGVSGL